MHSGRSNDVDHPSGCFDSTPVRRRHTTQVRWVEFDLLGRRVCLGRAVIETYTDKRWSKKQWSSDTSAQGYAPRCADQDGATPPAPPLRT